MKNAKRWLLPLIFFLLLFLSAALSVGASSTYTEGISLMDVRQNVRADGYTWNNRTDTLTLDGLNIQTEDDYGLKLPGGATVVLKGKNTISASVAALYMEQDVKIRGTGSLTLEGGQYGIYLNAAGATSKLSISGGSFTITGGEDGIRADVGRVTLSGGKLTIRGGSGYAVNVREFMAGSGVTVTATGSFYSSYSMLLQGANLSVSSDRPALLADRSLKLESMRLMAGESLTSLSSVDEYGGEKALTTKSTLPTGVKSLLFGESKSIVWDILLLVSALAVLAALIVLPVLIRKKKAKVITEAREAAKAEEKAAKKQQKKEGKSGS